MVTEEGAEVRPEASDEAKILSSYLSNPNTRVGVEELPGLVERVYDAVQKHRAEPRSFAPANDQPAAAPAPGPVAVEAPVEEPHAPRPAVPISKSVRRDHLVCLEDGAKRKSLARYIRARFDMTPDQYRAKWGLPKDYPMVAPNYSEARREVANRIGLGRKTAPKLPLRRKHH